MTIARLAFGTDGYARMSRYLGWVASQSFTNFANHARARVHVARRTGESDSLLRARMIGMATALILVRRFSLGVAPFLGPPFMTGSRS